MATAEAQRRWYQKRKAAHLCIRCKRPAEEGRVMCSYHAAKATITQKRLYYRRVENHQCGQCGMKLPEGHKDMYCSDCAKKYAERYMRYVKNRICPLCKRKLPENHWYVHCPECIEKRRMKANDKNRSIESCC